MDIRRLNEAIGVAPQIGPEDVAAIMRAGFRSIICNRPDDEAPAHASSMEIGSAARASGLEFTYVPAVSGALTDTVAADMAQAIRTLPSPVLAYCRSGARSTKLAEMAGLLKGASTPPRSYDIVIVGGGSAGIATAASILKRNNDISGW